MHTSAFSPIGVNVMIERKKYMEDKHMSNTKSKSSNTTKKEPNKMTGWIFALIISLCIFPPLFIIVLVLFLVSISKKDKNAYTPDHKTNISGSGQGVREEIIHHEKPIDYNKSTYDIYQELLNKKTDYSGVNKDLL
jgi:uncharacterized membrane protein